MSKIFFLLFLLCIPSFSSLLRPGFYPMHDDMQAMRLLQIDKCISDGQIPCRWVPDMGYGYGYPQFNYYAPLPYYIMWVFHFFGLGYLDSVKLFIVFSVLVSCYAMCLLASSLWGKLGGILSSVFYIYVPYRAVDMYVRGALGELAALSIIPFIFWSARKLVLKERDHILYLALSSAALFTSHSITAMFFTPLIFLWVLFLLHQEKRFRLSEVIITAKYLGTSLIWGLGLSSFFILPAFFEKHYVHIDTLISGYFNYISHFVGIKSLLFQSYWGYGSSEGGGYDDASFSVGLLHWTLPLVVLVSFLFLRKKKEIRLSLFLLILGFISLFMIHPRSLIIWRVFDSFLSYLQFPWRFLLLSIFFFSLSLGGIGYLLRENKNVSRIVAGVLIALVMLFNVYYFRPLKWFDINDDQKFSGESWQKQLTISLYDYLPVYAKKAPDEPAPEKPILISGDISVLSSQKGSNWQTYKIVSNGESRIRLPLYYFPNFRVILNGKETQFDYENELGLITLNLINGENDVEVRLYDTPIRSFSNIITFISFLVIPIYKKKKMKK